MSQLRPAPFLVLVVPCYNEEAALPASMQTLSNLLDKLKADGQISQNSAICYVDDGSRDNTWEIIEKRHSIDPCCRGVKFAGNAGHQNALWAGLQVARAWGADCAITIDADLQDDISVISQMIADYRSGCEIVYGVRSSRGSDSWFKRRSAQWFYSLMSKLSVQIIPDHADYRLMARPALDALSSFEERNLFLRGLAPALGFKTSKVFYQRLPRTAGETKYPLRKMIALAWQGITSCSAVPLRIAGLMGFLCMLFSIALGIIFILRKYIIGAHMPGWTSLFVAILFMGAVQLFCLAVMGEYIAKIFTEVRHRPRYIIEKEL